MKKRLGILVALIALAGVAHAGHRPEDGDEPLRQPPPAVESPTAGAPVGTASKAQIYTWREKGVLHAVSNPSDVPPRYSRRVQPPGADPRIVLMEPEAPAAGAKPAGAVRKGKHAVPAHRPAAARRKRAAPAVEKE